MLFTQSARPNYYLHEMLLVSGEANRFTPKMFTSRIASGVCLAAQYNTHSVLICACTTPVHERSHGVRGGSDSDLCLCMRGEPIRQAARRVRDGVSCELITIAHNPANRIHAHTHRGRRVVVTDILIRRIVIICGTVSISICPPDVHGLISYETSARAQ